MDRPTRLAACAAAACLVGAALLLAPGAAAFRQALPGYRYSFPRDHYSHPEFRIEWWYLTGHLEAEGGKKFGYQLTFFRSALKGAQGADSSRQVHFAHFAVGEPGRGRFRFFEKMNRAGLGVAGAATDRLRVWNEGWLLEGGDGPERIRADTAEASLELALKPLRPPVIHGRQGIKRKGREKGPASHYYSITRLESAGTLKLDGKSFAVKGLSWMDHEFSSAQLDPEQEGWDWFSIQLDDGTDLMLYIFRLRGGAPDPASGGTFIDAAGRGRYFGLDECRIERQGSWQSPRSGASYPAGWKLSLPGYGLELEITPELADQELVTRRSRITYWEGACRVEGKRNGRKVSGQAFVELTGYAGPVRL